LGGTNLTNLAILAQELSDWFGQSTVHYSGEVPLVKGFVQHINSNVAKRFVNKKISFRAQFVHQKPYAFFVSPSKICGKTKVELGDILFVVKRIRKGIVIDHRGTFSQAKLSKGQWKIDCHQFEFLSNINNTLFEFGNSVYTQANGKNSIANKITWHLNPGTSWFSNYLLIGKSPNNNNHAIPPKFLAPYYGFNQKNFSVNSGMLFYPGLAVPPSWYAFNLEHFFSNLLKQDGIGFRIRGDLKDFVALLYRLVGLQLDPPEEFQGFVVERENKGFAVVEIRIEDDDKD
jgi:hypothetical protein